MTRFDTAVVDAEIAELRQQHSMIENRIKASTKLDVSDDIALSRLEKKIREQVKRRESILAGDPDPDKAAPVAEPVTLPAALRLPRFMSSFKKSQTIPDRPAVARPSNQEQIRELHDLISGYMAAGSWEAPEALIRGVVEDDLNNGGHLNSSRAFTQALYFGIIRTLGYLDAQISAGLHYQLNRRREIEDRLDVLEQATKRPVERSAMEERLAKLEQYVAENPPMQFCGRWTEGQYPKNSSVEFGGSLWIAKRPTRSKPQPDGVEGDWQLAVRRGRDGKDAK